MGRPRILGQDFWRRAPWVALLLLVATPLLAAVPFPVQAALIRKILLFDRSLPADHKARFVLVYGDERNEAKELETLLTASGHSVKSVKATELEAAVSGAEVAVFFPHGASSEALAAAQRQKLLSFGSEAAMAQSGAVGVAVGELDGKPRIFVNLKVVRASGHDLSADLLNLATVIR